MLSCILLYPAFKFITNLNKLRKQTKVLDHCHKKNKVRGIICRDCNFGLGNFKDNIKTLIKAIKYLRFK
jgi:hypothetical protein